MRSGWRRRTALVAAALSRILAARADDAPARGLRIRRWQRAGAHPRRTDDRLRRRRPGAAARALNQAGRRPSAGIRRKSAVSSSRRRGRAWIAASISCAQARMRAWCSGDAWLIRLPTWNSNTSSSTSGWSSCSICNRPRSLQISDSSSSTANNMASSSSTSGGTSGPQQAATAAAPGPRAMLITERKTGDAAVACSPLVAQPR
ncbi:hypothetical protein G6F24_015389 [Rhizopus arrhizus]|nr:hypothetical protein G6F24_015389 [Rhizopus arrhizus]